MEDVEYVRKVPPGEDEVIRLEDGDWYFEDEVGGNHSHSMNSDDPTEDMKEVVRGSKNRI